MGSGVFWKYRRIKDHHMILQTTSMAVLLKPRPHQQQCRTSFALKYRLFDKVERCFDIVASVDRALQSGRNIRSPRRMLPPGESQTERRPDAMPLHYAFCSTRSEHLARASSCCRPCPNRNTQHAVLVKHPVRHTEVITNSTAQPVPRGVSGRRLC